VDQGGVGMSAGEVERIMVLILRYGLQKWRVGLNDNRKNPAKAEQWDDQSSETLTTIRAALLAVVPGWFPISEAPKNQRIMAWFPDQDDAFPIIWEFGGCENGPSKPKHMRWELDDGDSACDRYGEPTLFQFIEPPPPGGEQ
jgi:hypothetical protein